MIKESKKMKQKTMKSLHTFKSFLNEAGTAKVDYPRDLFLTFEEELGNLMNSIEV